jgi:hypothetical protein
MNRPLALTARIGRRSLRAAITAACDNQATSDVPIDGSDQSTMVNVALVRPRPQIRASRDTMRPSSAQQSATPSSSLRTQGPITTESNCRAKAGEQRHPTFAARRMGPGSRPGRPSEIRRKHTSTSSRRDFARALPPASLRSRECLLDLTIKLRRPLSFQRWAASFRAWLLPK